MLSSNEFRAGTFIEYRDSIWEIIETQHIKPGKGAAFVQTRLGGSSVKPGGGFVQSLENAAQIEL
jgi:elongation factor P